MFQSVKVQRNRETRLCFKSMFQNIEKEELDYILIKDII